MRTKRLPISYPLGAILIAFNLALNALKLRINVSTHLFSILRVLLGALTLTLGGLTLLFIFGQGKAGACAADSMVEDGISHHRRCTCIISL